MRISKFNRMFRASHIWSIFAVTLVLFLEPLQSAYRVCRDCPSCETSALDTLENCPSCGAICCQESSAASCSKENGQSGCTESISASPCLPDCCRYFESRLAASMSEMRLNRGEARPPVWFFDLVAGREMLSWITQDCLFRLPILRASFTTTRLIQTSLLRI